MQKNNSTHIYIISLASHGKGISGGDRIYIEFAKRWSKTTDVTIYQDIEGYEMFKRQGLDTAIDYKVFTTQGKGFGFLINYFARIFLGLQLGFTLRLPNTNNTIIYSASEFWMDSLPGWILKIRHPNSRWAATWFQTAPNPIKGFAEGERKGDTYKIGALLYWLSQLPIKPLITFFATYVLVNNELEKKQFPSHKKKGKALVVLGAVDIEKISSWKKGKQLSKKYDAVFQGRFHAQKGVLELVDIWKRVIQEKKDAVLVMIGDGPLMDEVKKKVASLSLEKNIVLKGYVFDGSEKYTLFSQSKVVVHPAFYDSGGMASAEAMAFGIPCVGFDLSSYASYYPHGMVKVSRGDTDKFARAILDLLKNSEKREKLGKEGLTMIEKNWSWDKRAEDILIELTSTT